MRSHDHRKVQMSGKSQSGYPNVRHVVRPMSDILSSVNDNLEKGLESFFASDCFSASSGSETHHYTVYHFQTDDYIQKSPKSVRH